MGFKRSKTILTLPLPSLLVPTPFTKEDGVGGGGDRPDP